MSLEYFSVGEVASQGSTFSTTAPRLLLEQVRNCHSFVVLTSRFDLNVRMISTDFNDLKPCCNGTAAYLAPDAALVTKGVPTTAPTVKPSAVTLSQGAVVERSSDNLSYGVIAGLIAGAVGLVLVTLGICPCQCPC